MKKIAIREPIWSSHSVGLNVADMDTSETVEIDIMYIAKSTGVRSYPDTYSMTVEKILTYPKKIITSNVYVHIVPIADLYKHKKYTNQKPDPTSQFSVVDNWQCAMMLDFFNERFIKPLQERLEKNLQYIVENDGKIKPIVQEKYDLLRAQLEDLRNIYTAFDTLTRRHENMVSELSKYYYSFRNNIVINNQMPSEYFTEQICMLQDYYTGLKNMLRPLNLEQLIDKDP